jgi:hypothetical protein
LKGCTCLQGMGWLRSQFPRGNNVLQGKYY